MSDEMMTEAAPAEPIASVLTEAPAAEPSEQTTEIGREMEAVHDELRPAPQPRVKGQFASNKQPAARPEGMPQAWGNDKAQIWERLDAEARAVVAQREAEATGKITELGRNAKASESFAAIVDRHREVIGQARPEQEFESLLQTKAALLRDPQGTLQQLARQLGVNLGAQQQPQHDQGRLLQEATQHLDAMLQQHSADYKTKVFDQAATVKAQFMKGKEDHWAALEPDMKVQAQAIMASNPDYQYSAKELLQLAYEQALKLNDGVRSRLDGPKAEKAAKERAIEDVRKATEARRLSSLNVGGMTFGATPKNAKNIEAEMEAVFDRLRATG